MTTIMFEEITYYANNMRTEDSYHLRHSSRSEIHPRIYYKQIVWPNVVGFIILHVIAAYGFYLEICGYVQKKTMIFSECKVTVLTKMSINNISLNFRFLHTRNITMRLIILLLSTCVMCFSNYIYKNLKFIFNNTL